MDRIDEAVLIGLRRWHDHPELEWADFDSDGIDQRKQMRAALLAGVNVLLGEPVATLYYDHTDGWWIDWESGMPAGYESVEVYAPSLGEGDGR